MTHCLIVVSNPLLFLKPFLGGGYHRVVSLKKKYGPNLWPELLAVHYNYVVFVQ